MFYNGARFLDTHEGCEYIGVGSCNIRQLQYAAVMVTSDDNSCGVIVDGDTHESGLVRS